MFLFEMSIIFIAFNGDFVSMVTFDMLLYKGC